MNVLLFSLTVALAEDSSIPPTVFLSGTHIARHAQAPPWLMIPHIVNGGNFEVPKAVQRTNVHVAESPARRSPPYQELHRFGSVANSVTFSASTYDQPRTEPVPHSANTCWYLLVALIINYCCLGVLQCWCSSSFFGENTKRLQIICGSAHVVVPLGVLIYLWLASPIDGSAGKLTGVWCVLLLATVVFQMTCGLCLCASAFCGFHVGNWAVGGIGSHLDWKTQNDGIVVQSPSPSYTVHAAVATPKEASQQECSSAEVLPPHQNGSPSQVDGKDKAIVKHASQGAASSSAESFSARAGDRSSAESFSPRAGDQPLSERPTLKRAASAYTVAIHALSNSKSPRPRTYSNSEPTSPRRAA